MYQHRALSVPIVTRPAVITRFNTARSAFVVSGSSAGVTVSTPPDVGAQKRGGRGKQATATKEDDFIDNLFIANTHDYVLCFSSRGQLYWIKVYNVPQGGRASRGKPIVNLLPLTDGEKITAILPVREFDENKYIFMATANGTVKKTPLSDFSRPRPSGIIAVDLDEGDYLIGVALTEGRHDIMLFSDEGKAVRFDAVLYGTPLSTKFGLY